MKKISFHKILRNDRLMIALSVLIALALWYMVITGPANVTVRTVTCTLNTANVRNSDNDLQVFDTEPISVEVQVQGELSHINTLSAADIRLQLSTADIDAAGEREVHVLAGYNSQKTDYEVVAVSPDTVSLFCDKLIVKEFRLSDGTVTVQAAGVKPADEANLEIGGVAVDTSALPGGVLAVRGPETVIEKISMLVANVTSQAVISSRQTFNAEVQALDDNGNLLLARDWAYCTLMRRASGNDTSYVNLSGALPVVATLTEQREIAYTFAVKNVPEGIDPAAIISLEPASVTVKGEQELLDQYAANNTQLAEIDFDRLTTNQKGSSVPVILPEGLVLADTGESQFNVGVEYNWSGYATRTVTWHLGTEGEEDPQPPVQFVNVPSNKRVKLITEELTVTVCGSRAALAAFTEADLSATLDVGTGMGSYSLRPTVAGESLWIYYEGTGYTVQLAYVDASL